MRWYTIFYSNNIIIIIINKFWNRWFSKIDFVDEKWPTNWNNSCQTSLNFFAIYLRLKSIQFTGDKRALVPWILHVFIRSFLCDCVGCCKHCHSYGDHGWKTCLCRVTLQENIHQQYDQVGWITFENFIMWKRRIKNCWIRIRISKSDTRVYEKWIKVCIKVNYKFVTTNIEYFCHLFIPIFLTSLPSVIL